LVAVILAGIFQIILGVMKAGVIGYFFPASVIKGMLSAIGIIIILKQIPHFSVMMQTGRETLALSRRMVVTPLVVFL